MAARPHELFILEMGRGHFTLYELGGGHRGYMYPGFMRSEEEAWEALAKLQALGKKGIRAMRKFMKGKGPCPLEGF